MAQKWLVTITDHDGRCIETFVHEDDHEQMDSDSVFWNLTMAVDPRYHVNLQYLPVKQKPKILISSLQL